MELFLNIGMAKICTILGILASIIYILRVANKNFFNNRNQFLIKLNRFLRKHHIIIGVLVVITGLIHGIYSSEPVLSLNLGTICWIFSILLGINWALRKKLKGWIVFHRVLTLGFLITLVLHILSVKGILFDSSKESFHKDNMINVSEKSSHKDNTLDSHDEQDFKNSSTNSNASNDSKDSNTYNNNIPSNSNIETKKEYTDGVYQGVGKGYRPELVVEVTIENGKISKIDIVSDNETPRFSRVPFETIPDEIVTEQSTEVDLVSGATRTSRGIVEAVNDALSKAGK
ncbi:FMN-binding protein [Haloimpatiens massiliensis]|uniref:FMN-binding protein n=1 Tax=Haloimpatiens massiliensis TaxID=1658110 RepID=UPI000C83BE75|nr:FMN-binding protein [Haloimpatiens massiliensis]